MSEETLELELSDRRPDSTYLHPISLTQIRPCSLAYDKLASGVSAKAILLL